MARCIKCETIGGLIVGLICLQKPWRPSSDWTCLSKATKPTHFSSHYFAMIRFVWFCTDPLKVRSEFSTPITAKLSWKYGVSLACKFWPVRIWNFWSERQVLALSFVSMMYFHVMTVQWCSICVIVLKYMYEMDLYNLCCKSMGCLWPGLVLTFTHPILLIS